MRTIRHPINIDKRRYLTTRSCLLGLLSLLVCSTPEARAHGVQKFVGGFWYDGDGFIEETVYSVEGVLQRQWEGEDAEVFDLEGRYVLPPFGNAHDHGLADARFEEESDRYLARGTFYVANPNSIQTWTTPVREKARQPETVDVTYANGGLTSSGGWPVQIYDQAAAHIDEFQPQDLEGDAYFCIDDEDDLHQQWPRILEGDPDFLKVYLEHAELHEVAKNNPEYYGKRGLDPKLLPLVVARAHEAGLRVAAHVTSAFDVRVAVESGVDELAHLPLERLSAEDASLVAKRNVTVVTTTLSHRPAPGVDDLDSVHRDNIRLLLESGAPFVFGTDSHRTVLEEAENVAALIGMETRDWIRNLVETTPQWIFPNRPIGTLRDGSEASFLILDKNPLQHPEALRSIDLVVKNGHRIDVEPTLPGIADKMVGMVMHLGVDEAIANYRQLRTHDPDAYDFSEAQLNAAGYALLQHNQVDAAIAVFALNVEMFPEAANPYDSLGEAYMMAGDVPRAIENYERSLELNPHNHGAMEKLEILRKK